MVEELIVQISCYGVQRKNSWTALEVGGGSGTKEQNLSLILQAE